MSLHPTKPERTNSVDVWEVDYLLRTRHLILCPWSHLIDVEQDKLLNINLTGVIGILISLVAHIPDHGQSIMMKLLFTLFDPMLRYRE